MALPSSPTPVNNLNAQFHGGFAAPNSAPVGVTDTQTLSNKTLTSPTINTPTVTGGTIDGSGPAHVVNGSSAATNFGTTITNQTIIASLPSTGTVSIVAQAVQTLLGVGCGAGSNTVGPSMAFTAPGGTVESYAPGALGISISANGTIDTGDTPNLNAPTQFVAKAGTAITFSTTSTLASAGCSTVPQYTVFIKAFF